MQTTSSAAVPSTEHCRAGGAVVFTESSSSTNRGEAIRKKAVVKREEEGCGRKRGRRLELRLRIEEEA